MKDMEETRSSLTNKLEALEERLEEKVSPVTEAVERATGAAADLVVEVKETVHEMKEKVGETVEEVKQKFGETVASVSSAFNFREHMEEHPWLFFGLAATTGCIIGNMKSSTSHQMAELATASAQPARPHKHARGTGNGWSRKEEGSSKKSLFAEELQRLKGLAIGALMATVRDLARRGLPGELGSRLADEVDNLTNQLGARPLRGSLIGDEPEQHQEGERSQPGDGSSEASETKPTEVNRLRSGGSDYGRN